MSYILEALKKADAERDRGAVPDLHAQPMLPEAAFEDDPARRGRPWLWLLSGVGLALIAGVAWQWMGADAPAVETVATPTPPIVVPNAMPDAMPDAMPNAAAPLPPASMVTPAVPPLPASGESAHRVAQDTGQGAEQGASKEAAPAQPRAKAAAATRAEARQEKPEVGTGAEASAAAAKSQKAEAKLKASPETSASVTAKADAKPHTKAGAKSDTAPASRSSAKASPPQATAERVPTLAELPDDVRRQVPALKLGGLVYSAAPASRMVLVNGDVQREGSTVAPGLTLERINPKSAVFALRGQRFEVPL